MYVLLFALALAAPIIFVGMNYSPRAVDICSAIMACVALFTGAFVFIVLDLFVVALAWQAMRVVAKSNVKVAITDDIKMMIEYRRLKLQSLDRKYDYSAKELEFMANYEAMKKEQNSKA